MGITMVQYPVGSMSACGLVEGFLRRKNKTQVMLFQIVYGTPNPNFFFFLKIFCLFIPVPVSFYYRYVKLRLSGHWKFHVYLNTAEPVRFWSIPSSGSGAKCTSSISNLFSHLCVISTGTSNFFFCLDLSNFSTTKN